MFPMPGSRGYLTGFGPIAQDITTTGRLTAAGFTSSIAGTATLPAYNWSADPNNGPYYSGATDRCEWAAAGADLLSFRSGTFLVYNGVFQSDATFTILTGRNLVMNGGYFDQVEIAAPSAPAANTARIFTVDATAKTRVSAIMPTGAAQTIATEP